MEKAWERKLWLIIFSTGWKHPIYAVKFPNSDQAAHVVSDLPAWEIK